MNMSRFLLSGAVLSLVCLLSGPVAAEEPSEDSFTVTFAPHEDLLELHVEMVDRGRRRAVPAQVAVFLWTESPEVGTWEEPIVFPERLYSEETEDGVRHTFGGVVPDVGFGGVEVEQAVVAVFFVDEGGQPGGAGADVAQTDDPCPECYYIGNGELDGDSTTVDDLNPPGGGNEDNDDDQDCWYCICQNWPWLWGC